MRVAAIELPHRYGRPREALDAIDRALGSLGAGVDLALLPETCVTGYVSPRGDFDLTRFAEPLEGETSRALAALAQKHRVALAGPLIELDRGRRFNALVLFDRDGARVGHWRKRHPWVPERWATPGDLGTTVIELAGARVTACVCFDIHFISDDASGALDAADVMLFPSAWVDESDGDLRDEILPELARRHRVWIVNANWGDGVPALYGQGRSRIVAPDGRVVAVTDDGYGARHVVWDVGAVASH